MSAPHLRAPILPPPQEPRRRKRRSFFMRFLGFSFAVGVVLFLAGSAVAGYFLWTISKDLPDYEVLAKYEPPIMTRIHAHDGALISEFARERRMFVPINTVPKLLIGAYLSAEDKHFFQHGGIDFQGVGRAFYNNVIKKKKEGASTITQQVAKNIFLWEGRSYLRKGYEAYLTLVLEICLPKDRILDIYLNLAEWGDGVFGAEMAARRHFGKPARSLSREEAARLAAVLPSPVRWSPSGAVATRRSMLILDKMLYAAPRD